MNERTRISKKEWFTITALLLFSVVPALGGAVRMHDIFGVAKVSAENARFIAMPVPVVLHIVASLIFSFLGIFQFVPGIRARHPSWHRKAGKFIAISGLISAFTGLWMTLVYPAASFDGPALYYVRLLIAPAMALSLLIAIFAVLQKKFQRHGDWMLRAYALGMGAGTQVFTHVGYMVVVGPPTGASRDAMMALGWLINIIFAEWVITQRAGKLERQQSHAKPKWGNYV